VNLGFLTVLQEANGFTGGYLVTNVWGRPLEFRLSTAVQPTRLHQVLYGPTLRAYVCADLIGKALVEKAGVPVEMIVTDSEPVLDLRLKVATPMIWLREGPSRGKEGRWGRHVFGVHVDFPADVTRPAELLGSGDGGLDLSEPFGRVREAMSEARRTGALSRAA
jgi:hypothetical protein